MKEQSKIEKLINPFMRIAGLPALLLGFFAMIMASFTAYFGYARYDGVLDLHFVSERSLILPLTDQVINWLSLLIVFYVAAILLKARHTRLIDIAGTMLFAKAPYALLPLLNSGNFLNRILTAMVEEGHEPALAELILIICTAIIGIGIIVWSVTWMYQAFKVSTNLKSVRLVAGFIFGLLIAEMLSKILLFYGGLI
jgi:hypothetical protein